MSAIGQRADWYPDPTGTYQLRYFDGNEWTVGVHPLV